MMKKRLINKIIFIFVIANTIVITALATSFCMPEKIVNWESCRMLPENDEDYWHGPIAGNHCLAFIKALALAGEPKAVHHYWLYLQANEDGNSVKPPASMSWLLKTAELGHPDALGVILRLCSRGVEGFNYTLVEKYLYSAQCKDCDSLKHGWENNYFVFEKCLAQKNKL